MNDVYSNWYVLSVKTGKENYITNLINKYTLQPVKLIVFKREILHKKKDNEEKVINTLFAGYIFVYNHIYDILKLVKKYFKSEYIQPVKDNGVPSKVLKDEMKFLLKNSDKNGIFKLSIGLQKGDTIEIVEGPLKNFQGNILWIDNIKKKAKVEIKLFNRKIRINLGIDFLNSN